MRILLVVLLILSLNSCTKDDNDIDCALFDPFVKSLYIDLIDSNGDNLIENDTYNAYDITIMFNDHTATQVVFKNVPGIENLIALNLSGNQGNNTYKINLSDNETDTLILNLTAESTVCAITFFTLNTATYNGVVQTIQDFNGSYLITVIK